MTQKLIELLFACVVICVLAWIIKQASIPAPFLWIAWLVLFLIALAVLLPMIGIHSGL
jgi:hypothetical protein